MKVIREPELLLNGNQFRKLKKISKEYCMGNTGIAFNLIVNLGFKKFFEKR